MRTPPRALGILALALASVGAPSLADAKTSGHHKHRAAHNATQPRAGAPRDGGSPYVPAPPAATGASGPTGGTTAAARGGATGSSGATGTGAAAVSATGGAVGPTTGALGTSGPSAPSAATGSTGSTGTTGPAGPPSSGSTRAVILSDGLAQAPASAPAAVRAAIAAGNHLIGQPYVYGGGHAGFISDGYDCSGSVSFALHGANLLAAPLDSGSLELWGLAGQGVWMTVYTNPAHAYLDIAGIRLDTSAAGDRGGQSGPRWRPLLASNRGFVARHPAGL